LEKEKQLGETLNGLATKVAPLYKSLAPVAFANQVCKEREVDGN
jgi:hypothetical protein